MGPEMQEPRNQAGLGGVGPARDAHAPKYNVAYEAIIDNAINSPLWELVNNAPQYSVNMSADDWENASADEVIGQLLKKHPEVSDYLWGPILALWVVEEGVEPYLLLVREHNGYVITITRGEE